MHISILYSLAILCVPFAAAISCNNGNNIDRSTPCSPYSNCIAIVNSAHGTCGSTEKQNGCSATDNGNDRGSVSGLTMVTSMQSKRPNQAGMEVLVLGLCRTGTNAMKIALEELGYDRGKGVYHMFTLFENIEDIDTWNRALDAKYKGIGAPLSKEEWDIFLQDYEAGSDLLFAIFADDLIAAYPEAKIILTTRSAESWYQSMMKTVYASRGKQGFVYTTYQRWRQTRYGVTDKMFRMFWEHFFFDNFPKFGKQVFNAHNNYIRAIAPPNRFLEFRPGDGWEPLCEFLQKDVPEKPWPKTNDTATFRGQFSLQRRMIVSMALDASLVILPVLAIVGWKWTAIRKLVRG